MLVVIEGREVENRDFGFKTFALEAGSQQHSGIKGVNVISTKVFPIMQRENLLSITGKLIKLHAITNMLEQGFLKWGTAFH